MTTSTLQTIGTTGSIRGRLIGRTSSRRTCTHLGWITLAGARATGLCRWRQLTFATALIVGVIAHSAVLELAGLSIAALVSSTAGITTAVAILACFHNAVATLLSGDGRDSLVTTEAKGFDAISLEG